MTPTFYPQLVNGRFGDPALYVDLKFEGRAVLFDLGDLGSLAAKKILRVSDIFVTHTHIDHFIGFDQILRVLLGREKLVRLFGPAGLIDRVGHKLASYSWNLVDRYTTDLTFIVTEIHEDRDTHAAAFHLRDAFQRSWERWTRLDSDVVLDEALFQVRAAVLDHGIPCIAYALEERAHVNVRKAALNALGLPVGPWLRDLKHAVITGGSSDAQVCLPPAPGPIPTLEALKEKILTVTRGQKIAYVVDVVYDARNADRIVHLAKDADTLFIEATFARADATRAAERFHLTTDQAGRLARLAVVRQVVPFHFSPRYAGKEATLDREVEEAFQNRLPCAGC